MHRASTTRRAHLVVPLCGTPAVRGQPQQPCRRHRQAEVDSVSRITAVMSPQPTRDNRSTPPGRSLIDPRDQPCSQAGTASIGRPSRRKVAPARTWTRHGPTRFGPADVGPVGARASPCPGWRSTHRSRSGDRDPASERWNGGTPRSSSTAPRGWNPCPGSDPAGVAEPTPRGAVDDRDIGSGRLGDCRDGPRIGPIAGRPP
jgi:hypothetical protein